MTGSSPRLLPTLDTVKSADFNMLVAILNGDEPDASLNTGVVQRFAAPIRLITFNGVDNGGATITDALTGRQAPALLVRGKHGLHLEVEGSAGRRIAHLHDDGITAGDVPAAGAAFRLYSSAFANNTAIGIDTSAAGAGIALKLAVGQQINQGATPLLAADAGGNTVLYPGATGLIVLNGNVSIGGALLGTTTVSGNLIFSPDNTYDIGASGATRARDLFIGRNSVFGGTGVFSGDLSTPASTDVTITAANARIGRLFSNNTYAGFRHSSTSGAGDYCLLADSVGNSALNAATGKTIGLQINSVDVVTLSASTLTAKTNLVFSADNTYDIGASGATRPRDLFLSRDITIGRDASVGRNLLLPGTAMRVLGPFENATRGSRPFFQSSVANGDTNVSAMPSGSNTISKWEAYNNATPGSATGIASLEANSTEIRLTAAFASGAGLPLQVYAGGVKGIEVSTAGLVTLTKLSVTAPGARVYNSASISLTSGILTLLTYDSERYDTEAMHSTSVNTGRLTIVTAGRYRFTAHVSFASNAVGLRFVFIRVNAATTIVAVDSRNAVNGDVTVVSVTGEYLMAAGDYAYVEAYQTSGGALNVVVAGNYSPEFSASWVSTT